MSRLAEIQQDVEFYTRAMSDLRAEYDSLAQEQAELGAWFKAALECMRDRVYGAADAREALAMAESNLADLGEYGSILEVSMRDAPKILREAQEDLAKYYELDPSADRSQGDMVLAQIQRASEEQLRTKELLQGCLELNGTIKLQLEKYLESSPPEEDQGARARIWPKAKAAAGPSAAPALLLVLRRLGIPGVYFRRGGGCRGGRGGGRGREGGRGGKHAAGRVLRHHPPNCLHAVSASSCATASISLQWPDLPSTIPAGCPMQCQAGC